MQYLKDAGYSGRDQVLLVAAADSTEGLPPTIRRCFSHEISMSSLTEEQRAEMLSQLLQGVPQLLPNVCDWNVLPLKFIFWGNRMYIMD